MLELMNQMDIQENTVKVISFIWIPPTRTEVAVAAITAADIAAGGTAMNRKISLTRKHEKERWQKGSGNWETVRAAGFTS